MKKSLALIAIVGFFLGLIYFYSNDPKDSDAVFVSCMSKRLTNIECPGCGGQRALHELLHGNFKAAAEFNVFIYIFVPLLSYMFFYLVLKPFNINLPELNFNLRQILIFLVVLLIFTLFRNL